MNFSLKPYGLMPILCFYLWIRRPSTDTSSAVMSHVHVATCGMCHTADYYSLKFNFAGGLLVNSHRISSVWDCPQRSSAVIIIGICHFCEDGDSP